MSAALDVAVRGTRSAGPGRSLKSLGRSAGLWLVLVAVLLMASAAITLTSAERDERRSGHYDSFAADGTHAYAKLLEDHGAKLKKTDNFDTAVEAAAKPDTTVVVINPDDISVDSRQKMTAAAQKGGHVILSAPYDMGGWGNTIHPTEEFAAPDDFAESREPACDYPTARKAGPVSAPFNHYYSTQKDSVKCYYRPDMGKQASGLVQAPVGKGTMTVMGNSSWIANDQIALHGNASLVMGLVADADSVVLFWPNPNDFIDSDIQETQDFVPQWVYFAVLWIGVLTLVALLWRGRRFGPLAAEHLPVTVPAKETVTGHAGLLQRAGARPEALRPIQQAATITLARKLSVPTSAPAEDVCRAVAAKLGESPQRIEHLLLHAEPKSDAELVSLAQAISELERRL